jgi:nitrous oxide reductase accessory protein NosL
MSKSASFILVMAVAATLAACAKKEEEVIVEPVTVEPTYTGKYK